jgi:hypothetical protein
VLQRVSTTARLYSRAALQHGSTMKEGCNVIATRLRKEIPTFAPENNRDNHAVYQREKKVVLWKIVNIIILKAKVKRQQAIV